MGDSLRRHLDSAVRDLRYTWRLFLRAPLVAVTIVTTVGLGLGLVTCVFTVLNAQIFQVDEVRAPDELFAVQRQPSDPPGEPFTRSLYERLLRETTVFSDAFASGNGEALMEGRRMEGSLVTGNFFHVLGVNAARGRTLTPADDQPGSPPAIVLSHRTWFRHFAGDPGVVNRTIRVNEATFHVVGVMPEDFRGLLWIAPEFWAPLSSVAAFRTGESGGNQAASVRVVGRLKPGLSRHQAVAELRAWDARRAAERSSERPAANLVLEPSTGTIPLTAETLLPFTPLFFAFGLILVTGCANVANLLLARGVARQREIGIRMAVGASRRRVVAQLLVESLVLALTSAVLGFVVSRMVLAAIVYAVTSTFPTGIGHINIAAPPADWRVAVFLVGGAIISTIFFALAPALHATRVELVRAIRGEVVRDGRPGRARDALVVLQVTGSVLLLISAAIFLRSSWAAATVDPGFRIAGIVNINVLNEQRRAAILETVRRDPAVASLAASWPSFLGVLGSHPAFAETVNGKSKVTYQFVSPEYFALLDIDLVRGRGFTQAERSVNAAVAVVSETVARELWPHADAVGQILRLEADAKPDTRDADHPPPVSRSVAIIGIARDVPGFRLGGERIPGAGVYVPISPEAAGTSLALRVHGEAERTRRALTDRLSAIDPNMAEVLTLQTISSAEAYLLAIPFWLTLVLGALALLLTLAGLFSVLSYLVERRTREIGVRMALGATRRSIASLVLLQSARPVGAGLLLGGSFTAALGGLLLATPAAERIASTVRLFDPVAYGAAGFWMIATCICAALVPALRAARINPVAALRQD